MKKTVIVAILGVCILSVQAGAAVVIDFDILGAGGDDGPTYLDVSYYSEDGFTLSTSGEFGFKRIAYSGSIALFRGGTLDVISMVKDDGETFDLLSIDFYPYWPSSESIMFTGTLADNTTIAQSFPTFTGDHTILTFDSFTDLVMLSWEGGGGVYTHFDNIVLVPEPCSLGFLGVGMILVAKQIRRSIAKNHK